MKIVGLLPYAVADANVPVRKSGEVVARDFFLKKSDEGFSVPVDLRGEVGNGDYKVKHRAAATREGDSSSKTKTT
jgi:hypothetical protein